MKNRSFGLIITLSVAFTVIASLVGLMLGNRFLSPADIFDALFIKKSGINYGILLYSRIPRVIASLLCGCALAVTGAVLQNVLYNKLASPGIIGVNAGAGFGVTLCCSLGILSGIGVSVFAFGGSLFAVIVLSLFASKTNASKTTVILGGVALNSILGALSESLSVLDRDVSMFTTEFRVGGFSAVSYTRLVPAGIMIVSALFILFTLLNELDALALGDETASGIGLNIKKYRIIFLVLSALLAGSAVSFSGLLSFVGLIVPHFIRKLVGNESRRLIPVCAVAGGGFVCLCDCVSRIIFSPYELPVGVIMSLVGGPVFVIMLVKMKGGAKK